METLLGWAGRCFNNCPKTHLAFYLCGGTPWCVIDLWSSHSASSSSSSKLTLALPVSFFFLALWPGYCCDGNQRYSAAFSREDHVHLDVLQFHCFELQLGIVSLCSSGCPLWVWGTILTRTWSKWRPVWCIGLKSTEATLEYCHQLQFKTVQLEFILIDKQLILLKALCRGTIFISTCLIINK